MPLYNDIKAHLGTHWRKYAIGTGIAAVFLLGYSLAGRRSTAPGVSGDDVVTHSKSVDVGDGNRLMYHFINGAERPFYSAVSGAFADRSRGATHADNLRKRLFRLYDRADGTEDGLIYPHSLEKIATKIDATDEGLEDVVVDQQRLYRCR